MLFSQEIRAERGVPARRWMKADLGCAALLALAMAVNWAPRLSGPLDLRWDGGVYYILGSSLARGSGYRLLNEPGNIEAIQYPPLLPAIAAVHQRVAGENPLDGARLMRFTWALLHLAYIAGLFWLLRGWIGRWAALALALLCVIHVQTSFLSDLCFTELPFALASVAFFLSLRAGKTALAGLAAAACYLLRTIGVVVLALWVLEAVLRRRVRGAAIRALLAIIPVAGWHYYVHRVEASPEYRNPSYLYQRSPYLFYNVSYSTNVKLKDPFRPEMGNLSAADLAARFGRNLLRIPHSAGEAVASSRTYLQVRAFWFKSHFGRTVLPLSAIDPLLVALGLLTLAGIGVLFWKQQYLVASYLSLTIAAVATAPWPHQNLRYFAPAAPFFLMALYSTLGLVRRFQLPARIAVFALIGVHQAWSLGVMLAHYHQPVAYSDSEGRHATFPWIYYFEPAQAFDDAITWLLPKLQEGDVLASSLPHWVYLRTRHKSVMPPFEAEPARMQAMLDSVPVRYILLDELDEGNFTRQYVTPYVQSSPQWRQVYTTPDRKCRIYERVKTGP